MSKKNCEFFGEQGQSLNCVRTYVCVSKLERCLFLAHRTWVAKHLLLYSKSYCYERKGVEKDAGTDGTRGNGT